MFQFMNLYMPILQQKNPQHPLVLPFTVLTYVALDFTHYLWPLLGVNTDQNQ